MPKLKTLYEKQEEIPDGYGELYVEKSGKWELTGIEGVKTQADLDRLNAALVKERTDHKAVKDKLTKFGDVDPDTLPATMEQLNEANARLATLTAEGKIDESKVTERITAAVTSAVGPLQRDKQALERKLEAEAKKTAEAKAANDALQLSIKQERIRAQIRDAAIAAKVLPTAIDDAVLVGERMFDFTDDGRLITKNDAGVTPGLDPKEWAKDMMEKRPHWWPVSVGGGSRGGTGGGVNDKDNPWSATGWSITRQGQAVTELGLAKAGELAARAGSRIGATKPTPKAAA